MRIIPALEDLGHIESAAERRVAELLAQVDCGEPATCLHSVHLPVHEYKKMSEIDFLVVWDDTLLVIEVKGGRLARRDGVWTGTDRYGQTHRKPEGPFDQARSAMFALEKRLTRRLPTLDVVFGYLVITPDQALGTDLEWEPAEHAGPEAMSVAGIAAALRRARRFWHAKSRRPPTGHAYRDLLRILRPDFDRVRSMVDRTVGLETAYLQLAERQYDLLIGAERNPRIACIGGAGSGKTLLAVETARRAAAGGARVLLTCRSPRLADHLDHALADTTVRCLPITRTRHVEPVDVLVVDEAQDLMDLENYLRLDALVIGGLSHGRWRIFCDPNTQAGVDGEFDRDVFDDLTRDVPTIDLPFNCRNTIPVVEQTQIVTGADLGVARAGAGPAVEYRRCATDIDTAAALDQWLTHLRGDGIKPQDIAVVTLRDRVEDSSAIHTRAHRNRSLVPASDLSAAPPDSALLVTAAGIKGLEAPHVCVVDVDDTRTSRNANRMYVAMTRPRISLWIALTDHAWNQLAGTPDTEGVR